jgi:hypothetical protein
VNHNLTILKAKNIKSINVMIPRTFVSYFRGCKPYGSYCGTVFTRTKET